MTRIVGYSLVGAIRNQYSVGGDYLNVSIWVNNHHWMHSVCNLSQVAVKQKVWEFFFKLWQVRFCKVLLISNCSHWPAAKLITNHIMTSDCSMAVVTLTGTGPCWHHQPTNRLKKLWSSELQKPYIESFTGWARFTQFTLSDILRGSLNHEDSLRLIWNLFQL